MPNRILHVTFGGLDKREWVNFTH